YSWRGVRSSPHCFWGDFSFGHQRAGAALPQRLDLLPECLPQLALGFGQFVQGLRAMQGGEERGVGLGRAGGVFHNPGHARFCAAASSMQLRTKTAAFGWHLLGKALRYDRRSTFPARKASRNSVGFAISSSTATVALTR